MEEKENKNCCENGSCEKCKNHCGMPKCCSMHKCHMIKYLVLFIIIVVVFCLGAQWGQMRGAFESGRFEGRGYMMNWDSNRFEGRLNGNKIIQPTDSVTVEVQEPTE